MARKAAAQVVEGTPEPKEAPVISEPIEIDISEPEPKVGNGVSPPPESPIVVEPAEVLPPLQEAREAVKEDEEKLSMRQRLREMEESERNAREALARAQRAQAEGQQREQYARQQQWQAQYDATVNTLGAAQAELAAAKTDLKTAGNEGNWEAIAEAQERIGRAASILREQEVRKDYMDRQWEAWKQQQVQGPRQQQPQQQPQQHSPDVNAIIADSGLPDRAKNWLREHPDYITDPRKNSKLQALHEVAERDTGQAFSDAYFDKMEELLGFKRGGVVASQSKAQPQQRQSAPVSAPPTREAPSMATGRAPQPTKVMLSAEEREIASSMVGSRFQTQAEAEREYARQKIRLQQEKAQGKLS